jgi:DNA helicase-2/ATP-dependent DNA helicase PcrA
VLARSIELGRESVDFDDMLYLPVIAGVEFDRYDVVLVDEAQDVSGIQMEMIGRMAAGRVIAVGDRKQSIYGFRGAGTESMDILQHRFQMRALPLSVSYRCPVAVVRHARQWVPQIEHREGAEDGYVGLEGTDWAGQAELALDGISKWQWIADFQPGDAILCRLTRPVVAAAFQLIRQRVACHVLGRDIGKGLVDLVRRVIKKARLSEESRLGAFVEALGEYMGDQRYRLTAKRKMTELGKLEDQVMTVMVFAEELERPEGEEEAMVSKLIASIERLFVDNGNGTAGMVQLSTIHKFKGLEADRVFILDAGETLPCKWARSGWEMAQERNCAYIAATRARRELRYITTGDLR